MSHHNNCLRLLRDTLGLTRAKFAEIIGLSPHSVRMIEKGHMKLSKGVATRCWVSFGVSTDSLFGSRPLYNRKPYEKIHYRHWQVERRYLESELESKGARAFVEPCAAILEKAHENGYGYEAMLMIGNSMASMMKILGIVDPAEVSKIKESSEIIKNHPTIMPIG